MALPPLDHKSLVRALSQARDCLRALWKCQLEGLADAQCSLEVALAAALQEEERLWTKAREERLRLQQELASIQEANEQAGQAGTAKIHALWHQLGSLHTCLLATPAAAQALELAQKAGELLTSSTCLALKLTWAHFVPQQGAPAALGEFRLEEQVLSLTPCKSPARTPEGQRGSISPEVGGNGGGSSGSIWAAGQGDQATVGSDQHPTLKTYTSEREAGLASRGEMSRGAQGGALPGTEGANWAPEEVAGRERSLPGTMKPVASSSAGERPGRCPAVAEKVGRSAAVSGRPTAEGTLGPLHLAHAPGTLFHARAIWVHEDNSDGCRGQVGALGRFREVAVLGSRVPSAREPLPRWASAESLGRLRRAMQGRRARLGGSCVELAETGSPGWDLAPFLRGAQQPAPAAPPAQKRSPPFSQGAPGSPKCAPAALPCNLLVGQWGGWGGKPGQLCLPHGLCAAAPAAGSGGSGSLYVVDFGNRRLQEVGGARQVLPLKGKAYFDVARGRGGCLALTSITWHGVEVYSARGVLLQTLSEGFQSPRGIAAGPRGGFLVADTRLGGLHVLVASRGGQLARSDVVLGFRKPYLVATNRHGEVAVSERGLDGGCCVKVLGSKWQLLRVLGVHSRPPLLTNPWGVSLDEAGRVLVADWGRHSHAVFCYPRQGQGWPVATKELSSPRGVALLGDRHLVVADSMHHCLKTFQYW